MNYEIYRDGRRLDTSGFILNGSFTDMFLMSGQTYTYVLLEIDALAHTMPSEPVRVTTPGQAPGGSGSGGSGLRGHSLNGDLRSDLLWKENGFAFAYYNGGVSNGAVTWNGPFQVGEGWGLPGENFLDGEPHGLEIVADRCFRTLVMRT